MNQTTIIYIPFFSFSSAFTPIQPISKAHQALKNLREPKTSEKGSRGKNGFVLNEKGPEGYRIESCGTANSSFDSNDQHNQDKFFQKHLQKSIKIQNSDIGGQLLKNESKDIKVEIEGNLENHSRLRARKPCKYDFDSDSYYEEKTTKKCETKNIIKNFVRSVLSFIRKNEKYRKRVLEHAKVDQQKFINFLDQIHEKKNTIFQLRELWTTHQFNQVFRLISNQFLRKHYSRHIFHSRIFNHQIHLKYRLRLLKALEDPQSFTSLKD